MKRSTKIAIAVAVLGMSLLGVSLLGLGVFSLIRFVMNSGITHGLDAMFCDQHLKTTVALVELHKLRYGRYPRAVSEIKFEGAWDEMHLRSVLYCTNADQSAYYVEVVQGWVGKPKLEMPAEFWQGTGYQPDLDCKGK